MYLGAGQIMGSFKLDKKGFTKPPTNMNIITKYVLIIILALFGSSTVFGQTLTIWPGDANNDSIVNNMDVLYIGQGFNTQGPARSTVSISFTPDSVFPWPIFLPDSTNYGHIDCNGDGFIDNDDLLAVEQNYGLTHGTPPVDTILAPSPAYPNIYFSNIPDSIQPGDTVTLDVFAGSASVPAEFFGIAFTILYDSSIIVPGSFTATPDSLLNSPVNPVLFVAREQGVNSTGAFDIALTRRRNAGGAMGSNVVLQGERLLTISFIIEDNLIGIALSGGLDLEITKLRLLDNAFIDVLANKDTINISITEGVSIADEPQFEKLRLYPQPATGHVIVEGLQEAGKLIITDLNGKACTTQHFDGTGSFSVSVEDLAAGLYFMQIETSTGRTVRKVLVD